ncbi:MAG: hypothetical protein NC331_03160 [Lachnospiraceae bacterium]|nr:hypothetical protein [Lachnospiraceae bacterium]MCM1238365.1 hypothetical protein [Lachnospiraceae bacterium]
MNERSYGQYKRNRLREQKKREGFLDGKIQLIAGICLLLYTFWILPFHADNISAISGDEVKAGDDYAPRQVYHIENLQLLCADTDEDEIYCIARFLDCGQNDWIVCFTPGRNKELAAQIRLAALDGREIDLTVSGYFQMRDLDDLPFSADSFLSVYGRKYADADAGNLLEMDAEYLCEGDDNYTLRTLLRPGIPLASILVGAGGVLYGGILLIRNRSQKAFI